VARNVLGRSQASYLVTTEAEFKAMLDAFFGQQGGVGNLGELLVELEQDSAERLQALDDAEREDSNESIADNEVVKLVNKIITDAHSRGASDIHVESHPGRAKTEVRFRIDGALSPYIEVPATHRNSIVARIKVMCGLDIAEKRRPQDGKIPYRRFGPLDIELRVATIPVAGGVEDVVMRLLAQGEPIPIDKLGLLPRDLDLMKETIAKPYGIFFVCGPTGSGKTTTLHSILSHLNTPETKIWTAEDPVEITQKGLRQVQINRKAGMDFATMMRAFLRADPDIIMVGEMRDAETTSIGLEASLTGHRVFATLHTNSAPESIVRLLDMGMDPFNFADALLGVLAQRLARRLCTQCRTAYQPDQSEMRLLLDEYCAELQHTATWQADPQAAEARIYGDWANRYADAQGQFTLWRRAGCPACNQSGYRGRVGLHELLIASDAIKQMIQERARVADVLVRALDEGMLTLKMNGIEKVLAGITDLSQVRAVCIK
jgi:type II secretory ATPase GspE/PulE/Tfp pilus assembly ATPase PilB-like protein